MMRKYLHELQHGSVVAYPLHHAALRGDGDAVTSILATLKNSDNKLPINEPDDHGRSAIFYAQLHGHDDVVRVLASNGWTAMPEGNIYRGPGGRKCFWDYTPGVTSAVSWRAAAPRAGAPVTSSTMPGRFVRVAVAAAGGVDEQRKAKILDEQKRAKILSRQLARKAEDQLRSKHALYSVTRDHKLYARKTPGCGFSVRATKKPGLNVCDYAAAYTRYGDRLEAGRTALYYEESDDEEEEVVVDEEGMEEEEHHGAAAMHDYSLACVARFVVDRRPTRAADGTWVVIQAAEPEDAVVPTDPCDDVISLASFAASSDRDDEWPALPGARMVPLDNTIDEVNEADWDVLDDEVDDDELLSEDHHESDGKNAGSASAARVAAGVWSGAAATRAAVLAAA